MNRYFDTAVNIEVINLNPGEYFSSGENIALATILGSCVSAALFDPVKKIGGLNHFLLPDSSSCTRREDGAYGIYAMELLINDMLKKGCRKNDFTAKIFGGGNIIKALSRGRVSEKNIEFIKTFLATEKIPVTAEDLGSDYARKIYFFPSTNRVLLKKIKGVYAEEIEENEKVFSIRAKDTAEKAGEFYIFTDSSSKNGK